jgi:hypothetical protein
MGKAVTASKIGLYRDFVRAKYQANGKLTIKSITVVILASLKDSKNGSQSKAKRVSIT